MIKLIIFDWDDVFTLGSKEGYFACYDKALETVGISLPPEEKHKRILSKWGKSFRVELEELLKEHPELVDKAVEEYDKAYWGDAFVNELHVLPGINELLKQLDQKYILAVATGNRHEMLEEHIFPRFNFPSVFSQIVSSHDLSDQEFAKPHPHMLEIIMKQQNVTSDETIFVGDAPNDVEMAFNAHVTPVVVLSGHLNKNQAEKLGVKYIIPDVIHLPHVLHKLD
jgi:phosphoglycolate phosphatase-like HAD superfamily hydrolase